MLTLDQSIEVQIAPAALLVFGLGLGGILLPSVILLALRHFRYVRPYVEGNSSIESRKVNRTTGVACRTQVSYMLKSSVGSVYEANVSNPPLWVAFPLKTSEVHEDVPPVALRFSVWNKAIKGLVKTTS